MLLILFVYFSIIEIKAQCHLFDFRDIFSQKVQSRDCQMFERNHSYELG